MKTVAVLNQFALPRSEGGGTRHADLFARVEGWRVIIVAGDRNHYSQQRYETTDQTFRLVRVPKQGAGISRLVGWLAYCAQAVALTVGTRHLSVVYASTPHLLAPVAGLFAAKLRRVPFILEVRDLWPKSLVDAGLIAEGGAIHRVLAALERFVVSRAYCVVVVTPGWEDHFTQLGLETSKLKLIPNGAELADFAVSETKEELRIRHGISGYTAVFAGAHGPKDGIDLVLDAAAARPDINFMLVGAGPVKAQAVARAAREKLMNVSFRDPVAKAELPSLLRACDVGVHAVSPMKVFEKGMSPNKLFDYIACGLPVVSNAALALRDVIADDECGRIGAYDSLADNLNSLRNGCIDDLRRWQSNGAKLMTGKYSRAAAADELTTVLDGLTPTRGKKRIADAPDVAHVTTAHPATDNRIAKKECAALVGAGVRVTLVAPADLGTQFIDEVPLFPLPKRRGRLLRAFGGSVDVWRALRYIQPKMIHVHDPELIPLALVWRATHRCRAVYDAHEDLVKQVAGKPYIPARVRPLVEILARALEWVADKSLDGIVAATPAIAKIYRNRTVVLVQNYPWRMAYDTNYEPNLPPQPTVGYIGAISQARGCSEMIAAVSGMADTPRLVMAGPVTPDAIHAIKSKGRDVVDYRGILAPSEIPSLLEEVTIGMVLFHPLPNHFEAQPTKLFEYMAAGRPFVASRFDDWIEKFGSFECGVFVDPLDVDEIRRVLEQLLQSPDRMTEMGRRGRAAVMESFAFETQVEALLRITLPAKADDTSPAVSTWEHP